MKNIFQKIIDREEPAEFLHEDKKHIIIAKHPKALVHYLIIPKQPIESTKT